MIVDVGLLSVRLLADGLLVTAAGLLAAALRLPVQLLNGVYRRRYCTHSPLRCVKLVQQQRVAYRLPERSFQLYQKYTRWRN